MRSGARGQSRPHRVQTLAVEAHAVDRRAILVQSEQTRSRIARLWPGRHRADLDETEAGVEQRIGRFGMLVESGREADRRREVQVPQALRQDWRIVLRGRWHPAAGQDADCQPMSGFRIEPMQQGPTEREQIHQSPSGGNTWRPSVPSGRSSARSTALSGRGP